MKECPKCKRGYGDEMYYCLTDGAYLSPAVDEEKTQIRRPPPATTIASSPLSFNLPASLTKPKVKNNLGLGAILLIVLGGSAALIPILSGVALWLKHGGVIEVPMPQYTPAPVPQPTPPVVNRIQIIDEVFSLGSTENRAIGVQVPDEARRARIVGGFRVLNGGTVDMYLMTAQQYTENLGSPGVNLDYKEKKNSARLNHSVGPGYYYILFIGWNPDARTKTIAAEFHVEY